MTAFLTGTNRGLGGLQVEQGSTDVFGVNHIVFTGATLTDNGNGKVTVAISGGGGGGGMTTWTIAGASGSTVVNDGETVTITGSSGITTAESGRTVTISPNGVLEDLNTLGAASSDGQFIVATGAGVFAYESGATARTSLGLGTMATQGAGAVNITGGSITGITDLAISDGGTGQSTAQAAIDALTQVSGATAGHVLTKVGTNATWAASSGGGGISFNGSTANGLVTYGGATTADVEANLTFDGSTLAVTGNLTTTTTVTAGTTVTTGTATTVGNIVTATPDVGVATGANSRINGTVIGTPIGATAELLTYDTVGKTTAIIGTDDNFSLGTVVVDPTEVGFSGSFIPIGNAAGNPASITVATGGFNVVGGGAVGTQFTVAQYEPFTIYYIGEFDLGGGPLPTYQIYGNVTVA